jgi:hypothetical protein
MKYSDDVDVNVIVEIKHFVRQEKYSDKAILPSGLVSYHNHG